MQNDIYVVAASWRMAPTGVGEGCGLALSRQEGGEEVNPVQITPILVTLHRRLLGNPIVVNMALATKIEGIEMDLESSIPYTAIVFLGGQPAHVKETPEEVILLTERVMATALFREVDASDAHQS